MNGFKAVGRYIQVPSAKIHRLLLLPLFFAFALSLTLYFVFYPGTKKILLFESLDRRGVYAENCFIPRRTLQPPMQYFVEELLLGPKTDRYRPLFPSGTRLLSLFRGSDGTLYVNLSGEAVLQKHTSSETLAACRLLEQNIQKSYNFTDDIVIAIAGRKVYEYID